MDNGLKKITVFTCTYNRENLLQRVYDSLLEQTCKDFKWLIIDDGSTDKTCEIVSKWMERDSMDIKYIYKKNGGIHTGYNRAFLEIETELCMCIDSDDYLTKDAIEIILDTWKRNCRYLEYGGIIGLDITSDGKVIGTQLPNVNSAPYRSLYTKYNVTGDKKIVFNTKIMKSLKPYPVFEDEKFVPHTYMFVQIPDDKELLILNEPLCVVEYQHDGLSKNIRQQYFTSPKGWAESAKMSMQYAYDKKRRIKSAVGYVIYSIIGRNRDFIKESPNKMLTVIAVPVGIIGFLYLKVKYSKLKKLEV